MGDTSMRSSNGLNIGVLQDLVEATSPVYILLSLPRVDRRIDSLHPTMTVHREKTLAPCSLVQQRQALSSMHPTAGWQRKWSS